MNNSVAVIIFDDDCIMCNRFITYVVANDKGYFKITGRKSNYVISNKTILKNYMQEDSIFLIKGNKVFSKAEAVAQILRHTSLVGKIIAFLILCFPSLISNHIYSSFAKKRIFFFSSVHRQCKINPIIRSRMLD
jgi:predicted DCC family thiol-disulfide oxidoreductase YuxK